LFSVWFICGISNSIKRMEYERGDSNPHTG
jgi:hypothetical protein